MRRCLILAYAANLLLAILALAFMPDRVAIHFAPGGQPDGWAPAWVNAALFCGMASILLPLFLFSSRMLFSFSPRWINLPNKAYWLSPERKPVAAGILARHMDAFGAALYLFLLATQILVIRANLVIPVRLDETLFLAVLASFLVFAAVWAVRLIRAFRIPKAGAGLACRKSPS